MKLLRYVLFAFLATLCLSGMANITSQTNRVGPYTISALPAALSVTFPFQSSSELLVLNLGASGTENDPATVLALNSDYTVSGGGYNSTTNMQSGTVTVVSGGANAVEVGDYIVILRNVPVNQATSLTSSILTAAAVEKALDKQATLSQQLTEAVSRSLRFEKGEVLDGTLDRTARMGKYLGFDSTGALTYLDGGGGGGGGTTYTAGAGLQLASDEFSVLPTQSFTDLTVTNPIVGSVTGNAATATALQTARTINGTSFNGTANITVAAAAGTLTGNTLAAGVTYSSLLNTGVGSIGTMSVQNANAVNITGGAIDGTDVTGLPAPVNGGDAATKDYVDNISAGITPRTGVVAATTANITLSGPQTIDGVGVIAGNRVLVKNQTLPEENGIYDCAAGAWSRSSDSNTAGELLFGYYYFVSSGTTNGATSWFIQTAPTVLGTDPVVFSQFSASQNYTAGTGLSLTGSQFSIDSSVATLNGSQTLTNKALTSPAINGGAINNATIGATTPATGAFTTLSATGDITASSDIIVNGGSSGVGGSVFTSQIGGTDKNYVGSSSGANSVIYGSASGDGVWRNESGKILFSVNSGISSQLTIESTGLTVPGAITGGQVLSLNTTGNNDAFLSLNNSGGTYGGFTWNVRGEYDTGKLRFIGSSPWMEIDYANGATTFTTLAASSNANLRTTKDNFNVTVNVKDYGATGDGVTNDTAAIAAAVSALPAANATLIIPAGTYITDVITITGKTGLGIRGEGIGVSILKGRTGNQVLNVSSSTQVSVSGLTFDGNCSARTAGQQAVTIDASKVQFIGNEILNSGEYALFFGSGATPAQEIVVANNIVRDSYADGINLQNVQYFSITGNVVDGVDDDCIAIGYNGSGIAQYGSVTGNFCRARTDLATTWGRGIAIIGASDIVISGNYVTNIKQYGLYLAKESGARVERVKAVGNTIVASCVESGSSIAVYGTTDCTLEDNDVMDPVSGNLMDLADWENLTIKGGTLTQNNDVFARGIHADEGTGWSTTTWTNLVIKGVTIRLYGASTNSGIYLVPNAANTLAVGLVDNNDVQQVVAGDYITLTGSAGTRWKIVNNTDMTGSRTINQSTGGVFTVTNNN